MLMLFSISLHVSSVIFKERPKEPKEAHEPLKATEMELWGILCSLCSFLGFLGGPLANTHTHTKNHMSLGPSGYLLDVFAGMCLTCIYVRRYDVDRCCYGKSAVRRPLVEGHQAAQSMN